MSKRGSLLIHSSRRGLAPSSEGARRQSLNSLGVGLQLELLEKLLCETIQKYCHDADLVEQARFQFVGLAARHKTSELSRTEINNIVNVLFEVLNSSPTSPPKLVSHIHSMIGLTRQIQGETDLAIQSFRQALWIETATSTPDVEAVGVILHRLGICHARNGECAEALSLLAKALKMYQASGLGKEHAYVASAKEELEYLRTRHQHEQGYPTAA